MKKIVYQFTILLAMSCIGIPSVFGQTPNFNIPISEIEISKGLKEALNNGISKSENNIKAPTMQH